MKCVLERWVSVRTPRAALLVSKLIEINALSEVRQTIEISVSFNGTPAIIIAITKTQIMTSVPVGAASGYVTVTTPGGTLSSNVPFQVLP